MTIVPRFKTHGKLVVVGDSRPRLGATAQVGNTCIVGQRSPITWFLYKTNYAYEYHHFATDSATEPYEGDSAAIGGYRTLDVLNGLRQHCLDKEPDVVFMVIGTNDLTAGLAAETIAFNISMIIELCNGAGAHVIFTNVDPRNPDRNTSFVDNPSYETQRIQLNKLLKQYADTNVDGCSLLDIDTLLSESVNGYADLDYVYDGVHWSSSAANLICDKLLLPLWKAQGGVVSRYFVPEYYDATLRPYGNLCVNSSFTGTNGTVTSPVTGYMPTSWRVQRSTTGVEYSDVETTVQPRTDSNGDLSNFIKVEVTSDGNGGGHELVLVRHFDAAQANQTYIDIGYVANRWYQAQIELHIPSTNPPGVIRGAYLELRDDLATDKFARAFEQNSWTDFSNDVWPLQDDIYILQTPPIRAEGTRFTYYVYLETDADVAGTGVFYIGNPILHGFPSMPNKNYKRRHRILDSVTNTPKVLSVESNTLILGDAHD